MREVLIWIQNSVGGVIDSSLTRKVQSPGQNSSVEILKIVSSASINISKGKFSNLCARELILTSFKGEQNSHYNFSLFTLTYVSTLIFREEIVFLDYNLTGVFLSLIKRVNH